MIRKKLVGLVVIALFLVSIAGAASAASLDLPKWVIVPEDSTFSDVTLYCPLDAYDATNNVTPCYYEGSLVNATVYFNSTTGYPKLVGGRIGNAFEFDGNSEEKVHIPATLNDITSISITLWVKVIDPDKLGALTTLRTDGLANMPILGIGYGNIRARGADGTVYNVVQAVAGQEYMITYIIENDFANNKLIYRVYINDALLAWQKEFDGATTFNVTNFYIGYYNQYNPTPKAVTDEFRVYVNKTLTQDEIKLLYYAGRKKLSEPANFRQIFSPMIDLTRDRATFYAGLEVSTTDPNGYVPVPESAVNMSITSAPRLKSDYTGADFYYQGHYWYRADKIQFNLPIQFETVRQSGTFDDVIILDEDEKQIVFEKEFKVTNPTGARINFLYAVDPTALGFSPLQFPSFELDGVAMASWNPDNSTRVYAIRTDVLDPGEISTHWIKATWTIKKEEVSFPAKLDDFRNINSFEEAQKLFENAAKGKGSTYVSVISITSNADVSNVTIYVPLKDVEDPEDVIEAVALTGTRETLEVKQLEDGRVVVRVPGDAFVAGNAEVKVLYSKELSFWDRIKQLIASIKAKIASIFGWGG